MGAKIIIMFSIFVALYIMGMSSCATTESDPATQDNSNGGERPDPTGKDSIGKPSPFREDSQARATLEWLPIVAAAGVALSIGLFFLQQPKIGMAGVAGCIALMVVSLGLMMFAWWMAVVGGAVVFLGTLAISVPLYKAFKQTVETAQEAKGRLTPADKIEVFGAGGLADGIQSDRTKAMVKIVKPKNAEPAL